MQWYDYFIRMADLVALKSKDPSTKCGVVVVGADNQILSTGYNGFPRGVEEGEDARDVCCQCGGEGTLPAFGYGEDVACRECDGSGAKFRWNRPHKYLFIEHAERNAIHNAARTGVSLLGATMYFNWEPCPCNECAKAVIQAGIKKLVGYDRKFPGKGDQWDESLRVSRAMLREAGVDIVEIEELDE